MIEKYSDYKKNNKAEGNNDFEGEILVRKYLSLS